MNNCRHAAAALALFMATGAQASFVTLYDQDFETPNDPPGFATGSYVDVSQQTVNSLYGGQPSGFSFAQSFTVETINLTGGSAFGSGYSDPDGRGETFALGMLSEVQDDLLGLSFDIGAFDFFNFQVDFTSLGLQGPGGPFANDSTPPRFRFRLYDNPTGAPGTGSGTMLDEGTASGTASPIDTLDWTRSTFAFDASAATSGNVTLQVDLLEGGYAAFDNFLITASDTPGGGLSPVPLPPALPLLCLGVAGLAALARRR